MEQYVKYIMQVADNLADENSSYTIKETDFGSELSLSSMTILPDRNFFCAESTQEYVYYFVTDINMYAYLYLHIYVYIFMFTYLR